MTQHNWKGLFRIILFTLAALMLVYVISAAFQGTTRFGELSRTLQQESVPIDVLCIGGSSTFVYWSPMLAFQEYGFSSYDLSESAMSPALVRGVLKQSRSLCNPELYVIDIRCFENVESHPDTYNRGYFLLYTDAFPYSIERMKDIEYAYSYANFEENVLNRHWKLPRDHDFSAWIERRLGQYQSPYNVTKGQYMDKREYACVDLNAYTDVTRRAPLQHETEEILRDLLEYIQQENLNVLFIINAHCFENEGTRARYNSLMDIIAEAGVPCLDTNLYYEEIGLDGATDFYNWNHINAFGVEKYTSWVAQWLVENYELPDHREETQFALWRQQAEEFNLQWKDLTDYYEKLIQQERGTDG